MLGQETDRIGTCWCVWKSQLDGTKSVACGDKVTTLPTASNALRIDTTLGLCCWAPAHSERKDSPVSVAGDGAIRVYPTIPQVVWEGTSVR